ncbi:hypothetical protein [Bartonella tamiae]|uniref:Uncharacterized protein n=1 Tax=Bartonella tamiae Th239 TaxID=1094558 RepID=J0ZS57_9HYPH|nr:hypothetical protein [Bartonella tamiae]EJF91563.1 hypothetical protein ME5_00258 [Bartonella tamiae Th239]EJF92453.1 hypothetical protein MEG_01623 [Bartonella tamiae Th307]
MLINLLKHYRKTVCCFILISVLLIRPILSLAQMTSDGPSGRYCGFVFHAGTNVSVELTLQHNEKGRLIGHMIYRDDETNTQGTVEEWINQDTTYRMNSTQHMLHWQDKYGSGLALLTFDQNFNQFQGLWGANLQKPHYPWTGKRCNDYTS